MRTTLATITCVLLTLFGCSSNDVGGAPLNVVDQLGNGASKSTEVSYWSSQNGTTGPILELAFFEDGNGRLDFCNDATTHTPFQARNGYDFTWRAIGSGSVGLVVFSDETTTFDMRILGIQGDLQAQSFSARFVDHTGDEHALDLQLLTGSKPGCDPGN